MPGAFHWKFKINEFHLGIFGKEAAGFQGSAGSLGNVPGSSLGSRLPMDALPLLPSLLDRRNRLQPLFSGVQ